MSDTPDTDAMKNWNQQIIDEFRANAGVVGGPFEGQMMALLTTTGAKTGNAHTTPLVAGPAGDDVYVIASAAGSPARTCRATRWSRSSPRCSKAGRPSCSSARAT